MAHALEMIAPEWRGKVVALHALAVVEGDAFPAVFAQAQQAVNS